MVFAFPDPINENVTIFDDGFEVDITTNWTVEPSGTWTQKTDIVHTGTYAAGLDSNSANSDLIGNLTSKAKDTSNALKLYVEFWFYDDDLDTGDFLVLFNNTNGNFNLIEDISGYTEDTWNYKVYTIEDSQYFHSYFSVRFYCRARGANAAERCRIDDVKIIKEVSGGNPTYSLNSTNSTQAGTAVSHNLFWQDDIGLSGYIFQFCNGTWNGTHCLPLSTNWSGWLEGWDHRKKITLDNTANSNSLNNYPINITLDTASLISAGKMRSDCGDVRFTDSDGTTELNYWLQSGYGTTTTCNSASTTFWVKIPSIPANSNKTIYMYYGNSSASSKSNGDSVFFLFDDFDGTSVNTTKWIVGNPTYTTVSGGNLHFLYCGTCTHSLDATNLYKITNTTLKIVVKFEIVTLANFGYRTLGVGNSGTSSQCSQEAGWYYYSSPWYIDLNGVGTWASGTAAATGNYSFIFTANTTTVMGQITGDTTTSAYRQGTVNLTCYYNSTKFWTSYGSRINVSWVFTIVNYSLIEPSISFGAEEFQQLADSWVNDTWVAFTSDMCPSPYTACWSNVTKTINSTAGAKIAWCVYVNDTSNNWNSTSCENPFSYTTTTSECSVAIGLSDALASSISFGNINPGETKDALGNNGDGDTDYYVSVYISGCSPNTVNVYIKASGDLTADSNTISLANLKFRNSTSDSTVPSSLQNISLTTSYSDNQIGSLLSDGSYVYLKFLLSVPPGQRPGNYSNTIYIWGGRSDLSPP